MRLGLGDPAGEEREVEDPPPPMETGGEAESSIIIMACRRLAPAAMGIAVSGNETAEGGALAGVKPNPRGGGWVVASGFDAEGRDLVGR